MSPQKRVVVTGMGAVSPLGNSVKDTWQSAKEGRSGIAEITQFDLTDCPVRIAGEVKNFDLFRSMGPFHPSSDTEVTQACSPRDAKKVGRYVHFALAAGLEAYAQSGLDALRPSLDPERLGVNIGVGMGGLPEMTSVHQELLSKGYRRVTPFLIPSIIPNMASGQLSILLHLKGPNLCNVTACTSSAHSLGEAYHAILRGDADVMLAGGAESVICPLGVAGFTSMKALSSRNEEPSRASRPFDVHRDGFVMGEGAAVLVLEELEFARSRGAPILAELCGYGLSSDAYHITSPAPEGSGGRRAMALALRSARLNAEQIGYINAHGTSTPVGDPEETRAIQVLFQNRTTLLHVSSTKSMTGHLLGAAGALEAIFSILALSESLLPPTINLDELDPRCAQDSLLHFVPHKAVEKKFKYAMSNSFGFGGSNASLIFGKYE